MQEWIPSHVSTGIHLFKWETAETIDTKITLVCRAHGFHGQRMVADCGARGLWVWDWHRITGLKPFQDFQPYTEASKEAKTYVQTLII